MGKSLTVSADVILPPREQLASGDGNPASQASKQGPLCCETTANACVGSRQAASAPPPLQHPLGPFPSNRRSTWVYSAGVHALLWPAVFALDLLQHPRFIRLFTSLFFFFNFCTYLILVLFFFLLVSYLVRANKHFGGYSASLFDMSSRVCLYLLCSF